MKTQAQVEQMLKDVQQKITEQGVLANRAYQESNEAAFNLHELKYGKLIAQYNILLEVLR